MKNRAHRLSILQSAADDFATRNSVPHSTPVKISFPSCSTRLLQRPFRLSFLRLRPLRGTESHYRFSPSRLTEPARFMSAKSSTLVLFNDYATFTSWQWRI